MSKYKPTDRPIHHKFIYNPHHDALLVTNSIFDSIMDKFETFLALKEVDAKVLPHTIAIAESSIISSCISWL